METLKQSEVYHLSVAMARAEMQVKNIIATVIGKRVKFAYDKVHATAVLLKTEKAFVYIKVMAGCLELNMFKDFYRKIPTTEIMKVDWWKREYIWQTVSDQEKEDLNGGQTT